MDKLVTCPAPPWKGLNFLVHWSSTNQSSNATQFIREASYMGVGKRLRVNKNLSLNPWENMREIYTFYFREFHTRQFPF